MHTPGHTMGSTIYLVGDDAVLTGDTLFVDGVGRPDLADRAEEFAHNLYHSLQERVLTLPDDTFVLPGHYGEGVPVHPHQPVGAPLAELRATLEPLRLDEDDFVAWATERAVPRPPNYVEIVKANMGRPETPADRSAPAARARPQPLLRLLTPQLTGRTRCPKGNPPMTAFPHVDTPATFNIEVLQSTSPSSSTSGPPGADRAAWSPPSWRSSLTRTAGALKVVKVDVDANRAIAYRYGIQGIPTIALFRDGRAVAHSVGAKPRAAIEADLGLTAA